MRSHVKCSVCGEAIDAEVGPPTKRGEFEYRFATHHFYYFETGTDDKHVCHLKPRQWVAVAGGVATVLDDEPPPPEAPPFEAPPPIEEAPEAPAQLRRRYAGELD